MVSGGLGGLWVGWVYRAGAGLGRVGWAGLARRRGAEWTLSGLGGLGRLGEEGLGGRWVGLVGLMVGGIR